MTTKEVANRLVALCRAGKNIEAVNTLMSADVVSVESATDPANPDGRQMTGVDAVRGKNEWWVANHEVHSAAVKGPYPLDDRFAVYFSYVVSPKVGPMVGKRMTMDEVALYTVADGKITKEEFFYDMEDATIEDDKPARKKVAAKAKAVKKAVTSAIKKVAKKASGLVSKVKARAKGKVKAQAKAKPAKSKSKAKARKR